MQYVSNKADMNNLPVSFKSSFYISLHLSETEVNKNKTWRRNASDKFEIKRMLRFKNIFLVWLAKVYRCFFICGMQEDEDRLCVKEIPTHDLTDVTLERFKHTDLTFPWSFRLYHVIYWVKDTFRNPFVTLSFISVLVSLKHMQE